MPGCGAPLFTWGKRAMHPDPARRDCTVALPLCYSHLAIAYLQALPGHDDPLLVEAVAEATERRAGHEQTEREKRKRAYLERIDGDIYFVRLNGLIKVGWSRDIEARLRAYGPSAELLCHYEGTRHDETNLHRQLRPFLAKGREWYDECPAIHDFINDAIAKHGEPYLKAEWTQPKTIVAGKRYR